MAIKIAQRLEDIDLTLSSEALTEENFDDYYVPAGEYGGEDPITSIAGKFRSQRTGAAKVLFTGYPGTGKSTGLLRLKKELEDDFVVIKISVKKNPGLTSLGILDFLTFIYNKMVTSFQSAYFKTPAAIPTWFRNALPPSLPGEHSNIDHLVNEFNHAIIRIKKELHRIKKTNIVFVIDDFEKLALASVESMLPDYIHHIITFSCHIVFVLPMPIYLKPKIRRIVNEFDREYFLPVLKIHEEDGEDFFPGYACLVETVYKRIGENLIPKHVLERFIRMSGGALKDLFKMLRLAADHALERAGKIIDLEDFKYAVDWLKSQYFNIITYNEEKGPSAGNYLRILVDCYNSKDESTLDIKGLTDLKISNVLLGYEADTWYDVHPIVKEVLKDGGLVSQYTLKPSVDIISDHVSVYGEKDEDREYPPIFLKRLTLDNIKCFKHAEFSFPGEESVRPWTLLVGDNGVGKTTILQAIALCSLGPELATKIFSKPQNLLRVGELQGYIEAVFDTRPLQENDYKKKDCQEVVVRLKIEQGRRNFVADMTALRSNVSKQKTLEFIENRTRTDFEGWFTAAYGVTRNLLYVDESLRTAPLDSVLEQVESLFKPNFLLMDPGSLNRFLVGDLYPFKEMGAPPYLPPQTTEYILELLDKLLPQVSFKAPDGTGNLWTPFGKVRISELSEGYKSMLAWLVHLLVHLLAAVDWTGDIDEVRGMVLLDEVDLHLHPKWQQQIIPMLHECFPNLQFIGCTHSPMTAGGAEDGDIILLEEQDGDISIKQDLPSIKGWRGDQILTGIFGLETSSSLEIKRRMDEYAQLLGEPKPSPEQQKRLQELEDELETTIPSSHETQLQRDAFALIEKTMAEYLNQQPKERKEQLIKEIKRQLQR